VNLQNAADQGQPFRHAEEANAPLSQGVCGPIEAVLVLHAEPQYIT
jgi:hypothetical protein